MTASWTPSIQDFSSLQDYSTLQDFILLQHFPTVQAFPPFKTFPRFKTCARATSTFLPFRIFHYFSFATYITLLLLHYFSFKSMLLLLLFYYSCFATSNHFFDKSSWKSTRTRTTTTKSLLRPLLTSYSRSKNK